MPCKKIIKYIFFTFIFSLFFLVSPKNIFAFSGVGNGDVASPYEITTCAQFLEIQNSLTSVYILKNDLDCSGVSWTPIGVNPGVSFSGILDGNNKTISNISIIKTSEDSGVFIGIFGAVDGATIKNLIVSNINIVAQNYTYVGGLTGALGLGDTANAIIDNIQISGSVVGGSYVGGLIGYTYRVTDIVNNSSSSASITGGNEVGGLIGDLQIPITNSYASGLVAGNTYIGGFAGLLNSSNILLDGVYATGNVTSTGDYAGGLIGKTDSSISNAYATGIVVGGGDYVGGLVGMSDYNTHINQSYATGSVSGVGYVGGLSGALYYASNSHAEGVVVGTGDYVGGFSGNAYNDIDNCYATGNVSTTGSRVGGFIGDTYNVITYSHSTGDVHGDGQYVGGFAGVTEGGTIQYSYSKGNVVSTYSSNNGAVGGFIAATFTGNTVESSYSTGNVSGLTIDVGGFIGHNTAPINNCRATGSVTSTNNNVGGFIGTNHNGISNSFSSGNVNADSNNSDNVGGLIGYNTDQISLCFSISNVVGHDSVGGFLGKSVGVISDDYALGNVSGNDNIGGFIGQEWGDGSVSSSYSIGLVTGITNSGGFAGLLADVATISVNSYYNSETSNQSDTTKGTPKTTAELKNISTFTGWNFSTIWKIDSNGIMNNGYPFHRSQLQNFVFPSDQTITLPGPATIISADEPTYSVWFAPAYTSTFTTDSSVMTQTSGSSTTLSVPTIPGSYRLYILDGENTPSNPSFSFLTVVAGDQPQNNNNNNQPSSNNSSSSPSGWAAPVCTDSKPIGIPDLFQINVSNTTAKLFFTPLSYNNQYYISFSTKPNAEEHGLSATLAREGVQNFTINLLKPNTTYYFKVRGQNGCMPGDWSTIMKIKTNPKNQTKLKIFYKYFLNKITSSLKTIIKK
jgi:hypothetical protein